METSVGVPYYVRGLFHFAADVLPSLALTVVAQLVEQRIPNPQVGGSIPSDRASILPAVVPSPIV